MKRLEQKKFFVKKEFELTDQGLKCKFKNFANEFEAEIPYEEIGNKRINEKFFNKNLIYLPVFLFIVSVSKVYFFFVENSQDYFYTTLAIVLFTGSLLLAYYQIKTIVLIESVNPQFIEFYGNTPDRQTVENFLTDLKKETKQFLIKKYAEKDLNVPLDVQLQNINWLKTRNTITQEESDDLVTKLTRTGNKPIGF